ncbi:MAG: glutamine--fructose-6-phosphate transaminase (isomerizing) [Ruminococcaceae bacterium]|nr:glutamine--fructose-6-phosphate transaminase (isomerizing) [Oscillospiraceae bacterium]
MCGIIGYIGKDNSVEHLIEGLRALEYRGYDSAGIAYFHGGTLRTCKAAGRIDAMANRLDGDMTGSHCGIGHTRWATHGAPTDANSHPHGTASVQLVHNGIVENYAAIREELTGLGYTFESETDTEAAAKLLDYYYRKKQLAPLDAIRSMTERLIGSWAMGILFSDHPDTIFCARKGSPLIIGVGDGGHFIASDITAILRHTRRYYPLDEGELAVVTQERAVIYRDGIPTEKPLLTAHWDVEAAERGGFAHFMAKEIHEEPAVIRGTLHPRMKNGLPDFSGDGFDTGIFKQVSRLHIVACGTAMHAGLMAKLHFGTLAKLPCEVEIASEFRYNDPIIGREDLVVIISQSGETADSLAALRLAKSKGAATLAIVNVIGSSIAREADAVVYTQAGPEIAVASTKAYSVQTALLYLLAVEAALVRGMLTPADANARLSALFERAPDAVSEMIGRSDEIKALADKIAAAEDLFFIGRGADSHLAAEGSLKLKEISYIHSEAYAAGELKHGTISLIVPSVPVIALCTVPTLHEKMISNIREVKARGAVTIVLCSSDADIADDAADAVLRLPEIPPELAFLPAVTALQLLAYHTAAARGCDIDKPRNLAKSVTVE